VLGFPKYGCVNVHASLLPKYRGAAPIQRSIIDGEKVTGVTTMYMEKGLDTGDMIEKIEVEITDTDNFESLHDKLASAGAGLIVSTIDKLEKGTAVCEKQDDTLSTYAEMITKETARIDWSKSAKDICNQIRGLSPVPKAFTFIGDMQLKINSSRVVTSSCDCIPGTIMETGNDYIRVGCGEGTVLDILEIQPAGKRMMKAEEYLRGNSLEKGTKFDF
jgi:methionyl-tRNA formyltransferase